MAILDLVSAHELYLMCAANRKYHDLNAEYGFGWGSYLGYREYAHLRSGF